MSDLSAPSETKELTGPVLICFVAFAVFAAVASFLAGGVPNIVQLTVAVTFFAFGIFAQSAYASIYVMEDSVPLRMSHAVGFSLWVIGMLMVLWWFEGSAFGNGMLILIAGALALIPITYQTFKTQDNFEALVDRSSLARGSPGLDDNRWILALVVFGAAVGYSFLMAEQPDPLILAFWAFFATTLLAPTLDINLPRNLLRLRDCGLAAAGILSAMLMNGLLFTTA